MEHTNTPRRAFDPTQANASTLIPLQSVSIATPCRADWSKMQGDDKSRFCQSCQKSVYNLSAMTTAEAQALIKEKSGNLCARIHRRADGTVITGDCPVGKSTPRRSLWSGLAGILAAIGGSGLLSGCGSGASASMQRADTLDRMRSMPVLGVVINKIAPMQITTGDIAMAPEPTPPILGRIVCPPTPKPKPTPTPKPDSAPEMGEIAPEMGLVAPKPRS